MKTNTVYYHSAENMQEIADNTVHLVVTSPPYFNIKDYSKDGTQTEKHSTSHPNDCGNIDDYQEYLQSLLTIWKECTRCLTPNGKMVINAPLMPMEKSKFSTHYNRDMLNIYGDIEQSIVQNIPDMYLMDLYVWDRLIPKQLMFGSYPYPGNLYTHNRIEFIGVFVKAGEPPKVSETQKQQSQLTKSEWIAYTQQIWNVTPSNKADFAYNEHPAIMAEEIARRCIKLFSYVDNIVLDPFTGSGTTLRTAAELKRQFIGYEIYEHYKTIIEEKLQVQFNFDSLLKERDTP